MGQWVKVPLPRKIYRSEDESALPDVLGARLIDCYIDHLNVIRRRPGLTLFADLGTSFPVDGLFWWEDKQVVMAVSGGDIYKISGIDGANAKVTTGSDKLLGDRISYAATDRTRMYFGNGTKIIDYDNAAAASFLSDADAPTKASHVAYYDTYILGTDGNMKWMHSNVAAGTTWTATSFFNAETHPDDLLALHMKNREIYLFGKESTEVWYNDGVTPFSRIDNAYLERGVASRDAIARVYDDWMFLDNDRRVVRLSGRQIIPVSQDFDDVLRNIAPVSDAYAYFIPIGERGFFVLTYPTKGQTFVYDVTTGLWAEWGSWQSSSGKYNQFIGKTTTYARGWDLYLVGDRLTGKVYKMSSSVFDDDGAVIRCLVRTGHVSHGTLSRKRSNTILIRTKRGVGASSDLSNEPKLLLRWRDDNGAFGTDVEISLGKSGETTFVGRLDRMGMYRTRQYEFSFSGNNDLAIVDIEENIDVLGN